jgi:Type IV secretion system pilin
MQLRRIKIMFASLALVGCLLPAVPGYAATFGNPLNKACQSAAAKQSPACKTSGQDPISGKNGILYRVSRIFALITAIGAVIVIIVGGLTYVSSGGDTNKANSGRRMIVGAVIGLVIVALAETVLALTINIIG